MTCPDCNHKRVVLLDGTQTCSWSEAWRAECEARAVCKMTTLAERRQYLALVQQKRGEQVAAALRELVAKVWQGGRPAGGGA